MLIGTTGRTEPCIVGDVQEPGRAGAGTCNRTGKNRLITNEWREGRQAGQGQQAQSQRDGGNAISYIDEDPQIRKSYEDALSAEGMRSGMPPWVYTQRVPPEGAFMPGGV